MHTQFEPSSHSTLFLGYCSSSTAEQAREINTTADQAQGADRAPFLPRCWGKDRGSRWQTAM